MGLVCISLLLWACRALGANPAAPGVTKANQRLVTAGPYQWVRHPIYTVIFLCGIAYFLISANWIIGGLWFGWIVGTIASLFPDEEAAFIERFGTKDRTYMRRTGRFLPRMFQG